MDHAEICPVCKGSGKYKQYGEQIRKEQNNV